MLALHWWPGPTGRSSSLLFFSQTALPAPARQQATAYIALALLYTALAAVTTLAPGWSLQHLLGLPPTTATLLQLVNAGAYLWLVASCLLCLKVCVCTHICVCGEEREGHMRYGVERAGTWCFIVKQQHTTCSCACFRTLPCMSGSSQTPTSDSTLVRADQPIIEVLLQQHRGRVAKNQTAVWLQLQHSLQVLAGMTDRVCHSNARGVRV